MTSNDWREKGVELIYLIIFFLFCCRCTNNTLLLYLFLLCHRFVTLFDHIINLHFFYNSWAKVFRIIPEFRILRLTSIERQTQNPELNRF